MKLNRMIPWKKQDDQFIRTVGADPFTVMHRQMDNLFADFLGDPWLDTTSRVASRFAPQIDLSETGEELRVTAELPGLDVNDIEVEVDGDLLTLKGEKKNQHEEEKGDYYHSERSYGAFRRTIQLPAEVDTNLVKAKFTKGVLEIAMPKKPEAPSTRKKIELQCE